ncbi:MAG TPA: hypothetical protein VE673_11265, partial [Pseudonocardiaceae bacterium]|nr:hypothetical protein [Pseudonocardiaceae bacterium]
MKVVEYEVDAQPGLRSRFRSRIGQLDCLACGDNASVASRSHHPLNRIDVDEPSSQYGVEIIDGIGVKKQVQRRPQRRGQTNPRPRWTSPAARSLRRTS